MNKLSIFTLKTLRKIYSMLLNVHGLQKPTIVHDPKVASKLIYDKLKDDKPCMIARFGSTEMAAMTNYLGVIHPDKNSFRYIQGKSLAWWWNDKIIQQMQNWSGFFPPKIDKINQFCELMIKDTKDVDILGSWQYNEIFFEKELRNCIKIDLKYLEPFTTEKPWSRVLKNKNILVIHPFTETIESQYKKREILFENQEILPQFKNLYTIKAVQSLGGSSDIFNDWFEALNWMESEIDKVEFDICLLGCGAYGFPLASYIKRKGKKAVHIGGALQLFFGIKGARWDESMANLYNEHWVRPSENEKPTTADVVEGACYW